MTGLISCLVATTHFRYTLANEENEEPVQASNLDQSKQILIVLPVLREVSSVGNAVGRFVELIAPYENVRLVVVGCTAERDINGRNQTLQIAEIVARGCTKVQVCEVDTQSPTRAKQVNYVLHSLATDAASTWVMQYDVDSHVSRNAFLEVVTAVNAGKRVIQQSALFLVNFNDLSLIQRGQAIYQSRWTISHEFKRFTLSRLTYWAYYHVVSHGLCINAELLNKLGGIPTSGVVEDIELGFYLCCAGEHIHLIRELENADSPKNFREGLSLMYRWSFGPLFCPGYLRKYISTISHQGFKSKGYIFRSLLLMAVGTFSSIVWNLSSYVLLFVALELLKLNVLAFTFTIFYAIEFLLCISLFARWKALRATEALKATPFILLHLIVRSFPANLAVVRSILKLNLNIQKAKH